ncbi:hypothetical protein DHEL01_v211628 [Diaporthe helianthi]|uniref:Heterokaryon incompatibility domain-containing protein n=1 Tax=Diaporthe helianthi TaxID=158607 RepID=A0A2P5HI97_DIAHE|nr:hypothetical protein DHEL01_v211628 [Diaporthe helianthi]
MDSVTQLEVQPQLYKNLAPKKRVIRLLRLLPGRPEEREIHCDLYERSLLDAHGRYKALSYAWGREYPDSKHLVYCNGINVQVSLNLYSALHSLRDATAILTIWVDALCIDQLNKRERTHQVKMMRDIYANSTEVIIWLGTGGLETTKTDWVDIRFFGDQRDGSKIDSHLGKLWRGELELPDDSQDIFGAFCVISMLAQGLPASSIWYLKNLSYAAPIIRGLMALLLEPWWNRIWVVQETVVSTHALVHYKNISMPWHAFSRASLCYVSGKFTEQLGSAPSQTYRPALARFHRLVDDIDMPRRAWNHFEPSPLLPLLRKFRTRYASDQRDKVFALIGLVNIWGHDQPLTPDYEQRPSKVYWETTKHLIRSCGTLSVLAGTTASAVNIKAGFPTWLTDWSYRPASDEADRLNSHRFYRAAGEEMDGVSVHGRAILETKGYCIDTIDTVQGFSESLGKDLEAQFLNWESFFSQPSYTHDGTMRDAFWRTMCGDVIYVPEARTERERFRRAKASDVRAFEHWRRVDKSANRRTSIIGGTWQDLVSPEERAAHKIRNDFKLAVECASKGRHFFITTRGRLGTGPPTLKQGDSVYVMHGSRVPLILRKTRTSRQCRDKVVERLVLPTGEAEAKHEPRVHVSRHKDATVAADDREASRFLRCSEIHDECYRLVGDAYVHGVMDGIKIWDDAEPTRLRKTETVYLV